MACEVIPWLRVVGGGGGGRERVNGSCRAERASARPQFASFEFPGPSRAPDSLRLRRILVAARSLESLSSFSLALVPRCKNSPPRRISLNLFSHHSANQWPLHHCHHRQETRLPSRTLQPSRLSDHDHLPPYIFSPEGKPNISHSFPRQLLNHPPSKTHASHFLPGRSCSLGGMAGGIVTAPFDLVKTRLQSSLFASGHTKTGGLHAFVETGKILRYARRWLSACMQDEVGLHCCCAGVQGHLHD